MKVSFVSGHVRPYSLVYVLTYTNKCSFDIARIVARLICVFLVSFICRQLNHHIVFIHTQLVFSLCLYSQDRQEFFPRMYLDGNLILKSTENEQKGRGPALIQYV